MALINCRECQKEISDSLSVTKCPHCGVHTPNEVKYNRTKTGGKLLAALFILSILSIVFLGEYEEIEQQENLSNMTPAQRAEYSRVQAKKDRDTKGQQAYVACRSYIRQGMTTDVKLAGISDYRYEYSLDNDQYYVYSWVEGQNVYGVWLKQQYKCTTKWDAAVQDWKFVDMKLLK